MNNPIFQSFASSSGTNTLFAMENISEKEALMVTSQITLESCKFPSDSG